jgi:hypothetical protein
MTAPKRVKIGGDLYHQTVPEGAVKVTRPGPWGNPYKVKEHGLTEALRLFKEYLDANPELVARARDALAGKDLACWCPLDKPCHADIWLALVNEDTHNDAYRALREGRKG